MLNQIKHIITFIFVAHCLPSADAWVIHDWHDYRFAERELDDLKREGRINSYDLSRAESNLRSAHSTLLLHDFFLHQPKRVSPFETKYAGFEREQQDSPPERGQCVNRQGTFFCQPARVEPKECVQDSKGLSCNL